MLLENPLCYCLVKKEENFTVVFSLQTRGLELFLTKTNRISLISLFKKLELPFPKEALKTRKVVAEISPVSVNKYTLRIKEQGRGIVVECQTKEAPRISSTAVCFEFDLKVLETIVRDYGLSLASEKKEEGKSLFWEVF